MGIAFLPKRQRRLAPEKARRTDFSMKGSDAITWLGRHRRLIFGLVLLWLFLCGAAATALIVLMRGNCDVFELHRHEIATPRWGNDAPRLRIAVLSDFHVRPTPEDLKRLERIVEAANAETPDLILLPGDFVAGHLPAHSATPEEIAARLGRLKAKLGVYGVLGNHDHWQDPSRIEAALAAHGIELLENRTVRLETGGKPFHLTGLSDWRSRRPPDWSALLPASPLPSLVMTHTPDVFDSMPEKPALAVAGHTHGGQVTLPLLGAPAVPSRFGERYLRGLIQDRGNLVFVTAGLGYSILKLRLNCPPEIAILDLIPPPENPNRI